MRTRYIQHPVTLKLIPADDYEAPDRPRSAYVMGDIAPYQSMKTGEMIGGRRQHREHLRAHGLVEVGNEKVTPKKYASNDAEIRHDIQAAFQRHSY